MNDKTRREDFDKKVVLPNVMMLKNKIHNEVGDYPQVYIHMPSPVAKTQKNKGKPQTIK